MNRLASLQARTLAGWQALFLTHLSEAAKDHAPHPPTLHVFTADDSPCAVIQLG